MKSQVVGRFAPSPSGRMHLGNLFSCLLCWLAVRSAGGKLILRIEDLDPQRTSRALSDLLEEDLRWLGLTWDEGGSTGGPQTPYYQSQRGEIYQAALEKLEALGLCYPCFCSRAELHAAEAPHLSNGRVLYSGRCRHLTPAEREALSARRRPALRVQVPDETISFTDLRCGFQQEHLPDTCGDFLIRRADGVFAYQLAVSVDDALMGVNLVVRGSDLLTSTPRQIWLQQMLGFAPPQYGHIPLLLAPDGRRLSKRDGDLDMAHFRSHLSGPEPLLGLLAWLGGLLDRPEPVSASELIPLFDWKKLPDGDVTVAADQLFKALEKF